MEYPEDALSFWRLWVSSRPNFKQIIGRGIVDAWWRVKLQPEDIGNNRHKIRVDLVLQRVEASASSAVDGGSCIVLINPDPEQLGPPTRVFSSLADVP
jgi:hypothetical protein